MAQNAITPQHKIDTDQIKEKVAQEKESVRDTVYKVSAAVSNAILVILGMGIVAADDCRIHPLGTDGPNGCNH